jgi:mannan endo-1,4-beta-mannosidase
MRTTRLPLMTLFTGLFLVIMACGVDNPITPIQDEETNLDIPPLPDKPVGSYWVEGSKLLKDDEAVFYKGVNTLQTYGLMNPHLMNEWNIQIIREFIGNLREQPIDGEAVRASDGVWYHPLQKIADQNRANNKITILCPFGWVNNVGQRILFTGLNPSSQPFYEEYKIKMKRIAEHFKNQPDVWVEVWNEPYHWNNENGYIHDLWLKDMKDMVDNLRWVEGFQNIIVVPGNEQGQSENAIITKGKELLQGRYNLLFDVHAYEKWLLNTSEDELISKIENIKNMNFALIIGEVGVQNAGQVMPVQHFLNAATITKVSVLAWLWNQNSQDNNSLLTDDGLPNGTAINNFWGTKYKYFLNN